MKRTLASLALCAAMSAAFAVDAARLDYQLAARELAPGVWVVEGANADFSPSNGCNIINTGFIATGAGTLVINTGPSRLYGEQLRALAERTTREPVVQAIQLNLHPDYFLGHQAFADVPRVASALTREGVAREAAAYESNLYRVCGDWMKGTQALPPDTTLDTSSGRGVLRVGTRELEWRALSGHTASDLVVIDRASGVAFVGGLVFHDRVPTTPHADVAAWLASLDAIDATTIVPSHGPVEHATEGIAQTRRYLQWLDAQFTRWAEQGLDLAEVLRAPVPEEFRAWAAFASEYPRNAMQLYPRYERRVLQR